ncbi:MAG: hypothetical protein E7H54_05405 [Clostridium perfringens]|uniref:hypothetical protein n=1 Tax=Clostridium perfringens TaxID=1502 RepID=UPI0024BCBFC6|nr:hypothetical protein [Clostridium perfringens]MDU8988600.1 hypothetical protein [Clostridium perfringens]
MCKGFFEVRECKSNMIKVIFFATLAMCMIGLTRKGICLQYILGIVMGLFVMGEFAFDYKGVTSIIESKLGNNLKAFVLSAIAMFSLEGISLLLLFGM